MLHLFFEVPVEVRGNLLGAYPCGYGVKGAVPLGIWRFLLRARALEHEFLQLPLDWLEVGTKYIAVVIHTPWDEATRTHERRRRSFA